MTFLPIVERELRVAARRPATYRARLFAAGGVMLIWLLLVGGSRQASAAELSKTLFIAFGVIALGFCLLAGIFLTADCLSQEKREGTLGLLFLTDLKGYDVVLGKLLATSAHSVYGLLAVFPILGLPLLLGGVTGAEFGRVVLVLLVTLFLSLSLGMAVSAISHDARQAMAGTLLGMLLLAGILPALWWLRFTAFSAGRWNGLMAPSPVRAFICAFDAYYSTRNGPGEFWFSVQLLGAVGLGLLILAALLLPRAWHEKVRETVRNTANSNLSNLMPATTEGVFQAFVKGLRRFFPTLFKVKRFTVWLARASLGITQHGPPADGTNPYLWLSGRPRSSESISRILFLLLLAFWLVFLLVSVSLKSGKDAFVACLFSAYAVHQVGKYLVAVEATRQLSEDRQIGALELLLVTPLKESQIESGRSIALWRRLRPLLVLLLGVNFVMCLAVWFFPNRLSMNGRVQAVFTELFVGGALLLLADLWALAKVGMPMALRAKRHQRAVLATCLRVLAVPWSALFLMIFLMVNFKGGISEAALSVIFAVWFFVGLFTSIVVDALASVSLPYGLRMFVSEGMAHKQKQSFEPLLARSRSAFRSLETEAVK
jgi:hypothetical protein